MALTRPLKEGSVTTYQAKVALGFPDILASEMDADLDTIYAAWNTTAGGDLQGNYPNPTIIPAARSKWTVSGTTLTPTDATLQVSVPATATNDAVRVGSRTVKTHIVSDTLKDCARFGCNIYLNAAENALVRDDSSKVGWLLSLDALADSCTLTHLTATSTATIPLTVDSAGNLTLAPSSATYSQIMPYGYGTTGGLVRTYQARGVPGAPTATQGSDVLGSFSTSGYGTAYVEAGIARWSAAEVWTATAHGTHFFLYTTPIGAAGPSSNLLFDQAGNLTISGNTAVKASGTTWANPSDRRLKDEIADYASGLAAILQLQPRTFVYNGKGGSTAGQSGYGFIADEVASAMPEMVENYHYTREGADDTDTDYATVDQSNLILALVNAVKELATRMTAVEAR